MKVLIKSVNREVKVGDVLLLKSGEKVTVTGDFRRGLLASNSQGDVSVIEPADIIDIIVEVVQKLGLFEKFILWLKRQLG